MTRTGKEDLRVQRTKELIRKAFEEMVCEMDYEKITIKELAERARVNRKTFYLHYETLDDLFGEFQKAIAADLIKRLEGMEKPRDVNKMVREVFLYTEGLGKLGEMINASDRHMYMSQSIVNEIMEKTWRQETKRQYPNPYVQSIIMVFVTHSTLVIYRQWVKDGREIPLEGIIKIATQLICDGLNNFEYS